MMYNDVPFDPKNPYPGELYNHPGDDVQNVYDGIVIDYEKDTVNSENVIKVLTGDESAGGKVLKSTKDDNAFLFFSDHGGRNVLGLPKDELYANDLIAAIKTMHEKQMYKKFLLYIEACHSGSMFVNLPEVWNVVAVTAANPDEPSFGWYCGGSVAVKGKKFGTCLGDEFSISWMEDINKNGRQVTLEDHFNYLVKQVTESHVCRYGNISFKNDSIGEYIGFTSMKDMSFESQYSFDHWDSRDNKLKYFRYMADSTTGYEKQKWEAAVKEELNHRSQVDKYFASLTTNPHYYKAAEDVKDFGCYKRAINQFIITFGRSDYALKYYEVFANMCNEDSHSF